MPPMTKARHQKSAERCQRCARCCTYFCLQIDEPDERDDFEDLAWLLAHKGVAIHVEGKDWQLMVQNRCRFLTPEGCAIYETRPRICREHTPGECDYERGHEHDYDDVDIAFTTLEGLYAYRDEHFPERPKRKRKKAKKKTTRKRKRAKR